MEGVACLPAPPNNPPNELRRLGSLNRPAKLPIPGRGGIVELGVGALRGEVGYRYQRIDIDKIRIRNEPLRILIIKDKLY